MAKAEKRVLRLGVAGLGRAFTLMLPTLAGDARIALVAAADTRDEARARFAADYSAKVYDTVEALCADPNVEVVYIATPHQDHAQHAEIAAKHGKHMLIEKPLALTLAQCTSIIDVARLGCVHAVVGHSHSFDAPVLRLRALIASGEFGAVHMINAINYTDYVYRPRRPEELDTAQGGGAIFSQAAHQVDIVRLLGGGLVTGVHAATGAWDATRPTEGAYAALLTFANGAFASLSYNGYGHFDSDEFQGWVGEMGLPKTPYPGPRWPRFANAKDEATFKNARHYGSPDFKPIATKAPAHHHFGTVLVSCERADLRAMPNGVMIYQNGTARLDVLPPPVLPRAEVIDELYAAAMEGKAPLHSAAWATATLEVMLEILRTSHGGQAVLLHQIAVP